MISRAESFLERMAARRSTARRKQMSEVGCMVWEVLGERVAVTASLSVSRRVIEGLLRFEATVSQGKWRREGVFCGAEAEKGRTMWRGLAILASKPKLR